MHCIYFWDFRFPLNSSPSPPNINKQKSAEDGFTVNTTAFNFILYYIRYKISICLFFNYLRKTKIWGVYHSCHSIRVALIPWSIVKNCLSVRPQCPLQVAPQKRASFKQNMSWVIFSEINSKIRLNWDFKSDVQILERKYNWSASIK